MTVSDALLKSVKARLGVTWTDDATDGALMEMISQGMDYLNKIAGEALDYDSPGDGRTLLFEYVRYVRDNALDAFENHYQSLLVALQTRVSLMRREAEANEQAETSVSDGQ